MSSILLIQSDPAVARRMTDALGADARFAVYGCASTLDCARRLIATRTPDLLIAALRLPDGALFELLRELRPGRSHTLVLTASLHDPHLMHALRMGADGFLLAGFSAEALLDAVRQTLAGQSPIAPEIARRLLAHFDGLNAPPIAPGAPVPQALDAAERRLLEWASQGCLMHEIARGLSITPAQVGVRVRTLYRRIQFELRLRPRAAACR